MNNLGFRWKRLTAATIIALLSSFGITTIALVSPEATTAQNEMISEQECPDGKKHLNESRKEYLEKYDTKIKEYKSKIEKYKNKYQGKIQEYQNEIDKYQDYIRSLTKESPKDVNNWVWQEICENKEADLSGKEIPGELLRTIIVDEKFKKYLPTKVTIKNATITGKLDLSAEEIKQQLHLESSTFQGKVNLRESKFSQSLYLDGSTFKKPLDMESAIFERSLYIRGAKFNNADNNTLNLSKARIDGTLSLTSSGNPILPESEADENQQNTEDMERDNKPTKFEFDCKEIKKPKDGLMRIVNLQLIEIKQSLDIRKLQLNQKNTCDYSKKVHKGKEPLFFANSSKIGDAIIIDGDTGFDELNFHYSNANMLVFAISSTTKNKLDKIGFDNILDKFDSKIYGENLGYLLKQKVNLREVKLDQITVYARKPPSEAEINSLYKKLILENNLSYLLRYLLEQEFALEKVELDKILVYPRKYSEEEDNNLGKNGNISNNNECNIEVDGLVFETMDTLAGKLFLICLNQHYETATSLSIDDDNEEERLRKIQKKYDKIFDLLQPFEHAAKTAKKFGRYTIANQMLYKRKSLELHITGLKLKENFDFGTLLEFLCLWISDWFYGFGYYRVRAFVSGLFIFVVGLLLTCRQMARKQRIITYSTILDTLTHTVHKNNSTPPVFKSLKGIEPDLEFFENIEAIIFDNDENQKLNTFKFFLQQKEHQSNNSSSKYINICLRDEKELKYFIYRLETINPDAKKIGFCHNFYGHNNLYLIIPYYGTRKKLNSGNLEIKDIKKVKLFCIKQERKIKVLLRCFDFLQLWEFHSRKSVWRSLIYSFDNMFPIIELDKELQQFIFEDSEGGTRLWLHFQHFISKIILIILLPILFF
ncbi:MAG: pentapeptide repeat-containing protein [Crocosphaera sp.]|nr:pentapeptide repeat-containing protein [Crocosphaera sp.]